MYLIAFCTTNDGEYMGATKGGRNKFQTLHTIWKQLYDEGKITKVSDIYSTCLIQSTR